LAEAVGLSAGRGGLGYRQECLCYLEDR